MIDIKQMYFMIPVACNIPIVDLLTRYVYIYVN